MHKTVTQRVAGQILKMQITRICRPQISTLHDRQHGREKSARQPVSLGVRPGRSMPRLPAMLHIHCPLNIAIRDELREVQRQRPFL